VFVNDGLGDDVGGVSVEPGASTVGLPLGNIIGLGFTVGFFEVVGFFVGVAFFVGIGLTLVIVGFFVTEGVDEAPKAP